jgi:hemerythrin
MPIQWTASFALGVPELDGQHLQIDAHLRMLHDPICEGRVPDLERVLGGLHAVAAHHFECEEAFMREHAYPDLAAHAASHRALLARLVSFEEARAREGSSMRLAMELANWIGAWIRDHQGCEVDLRRYVAATGRVGGG